MASFLSGLTGKISLMKTKSSTYRPGCSLNSHVLQSLKDPIKSVKNWSIKKRVLESFFPGIPSGYLPKLSEQSRLDYESECSCVNIMWGIWIGTVLEKEQAAFGSTFTACKEFFVNTLCNEIKDDLWSKFSGKFAEVWSTVGILDPSYITVSSIPTLIKCIHRCGNLMSQEERQKMHETISVPEDAPRRLAELFSSVDISPTVKVIISIYFLADYYLTPDIHKSLIGPIFTLIFSISRPSASSDTWSKKTKPLDSEFSGWSLPALNLINYNFDSASQLSSVVIYHAKQGLDMGTVCTVIKPLAESFIQFLPNISSMIDQTQYKFLTIPLAIKSAVSTYKDVGWMTLFRRYPTLLEEFEIYIQYMRIIKGNPYVGFFIEGIASRIPNLAYLCVRLSIEIGGNASLQSYGGYGGDKIRKTVPMKKQIDKFIIDLLASSKEGLMVPLTQEELDRDHRRNARAYDLIREALSFSGKDSDTSDAVIPTLPINLRGDHSSNDDSDGDDYPYGAGGSRSRAIKERSPERRGQKRSKKQPPSDRKRSPTKGEGSSGMRKKRRSHSGESHVMSENHRSFPLSPRSSDSEHTEDLEESDNDHVPRETVDSGAVAPHEERLEVESIPPSSPDVLMAPPGSVATPSSSGTQRAKPKGSTSRSTSD